VPEIDGAKILVIGGAGFVGSHIVDQLVQESVTEIEGPQLRIKNERIRTTKEK
jgi:nucleoside-diphosphate-sugar epimerase